mgnify:CR=1 FL=1|tara:strand:- start:216 stop:371 length:156 start_codon:yes stop_codon:yes gene_type:complete
MTQKEIDQLSHDQLQALEIESQRAWEDKRRDKAQEAMQTHREYIQESRDEK